MTELKPCPFCGEIPVFDPDQPGTCLDITCCISMGIQKSDVFSREENATWNQKTYYYGEKEEAKALAEIVSRWNTRV